MKKLMRPSEIRTTLNRIGMRKRQRGSGQSVGVQGWLSVCSVWHGEWRIIDNLAPQVGLESSVKRIFNNMQVSG